MINGQIAKLGNRAGEQDEVKINDQKIELAEEKKYIIVNKPKGYVCTNRNFKGEKNIFELLDGAETRQASFLHAAGRLDKNSRGLVLLTNDGDLTEKLTHPRHEHEKEYVVLIENKRLRLSSERGQIKNYVKDIIFKFKNGINIGEGDGIVKVKKIEYLRANKFKIILTEGKKRQIRRMFKALDFKVEDLRRVRVGNLKLGNLREGGYRKLNNKEIGYKNNLMKSK